MRALITAGPTREAIDPVRYIGNRSSGKMGAALARAAVQAGLETTVILGPVTVAFPTQARRLDVESAAQMPGLPARIEGKNQPHGEQKRPAIVKIRPICNRSRCHSTIRGPAAA